METIKRIYNTKYKSFENIAMFTLAVMPILSYYKAFGPLIYSSLIALVLLIIGIVTKRINIGNMYTGPFLFFWGYVAINFLFSMKSLGPSALFPGGINFFIFALIVGFYGTYFNIELLRKFMTIVFIAASVIFLFQNGVFLLTGERISFFLPLGNELNYGELTATQLRDVQVNRGERFCAFFAESSYFAQYGVFTLILELFNDKNKSKLVTSFVLFYIIIIVLSRSGVGYLASAFVITIKIIHYALDQKSFKHLLLLMLVIPIGVIAVNKYMETDYGAQMMERADELNSNAPSSGFARVIQSSLVYESLDLNDKVFGVNNEFVDNLQENNIFINGLYNVLIVEGFVGMLLLVIFYLSGMIKKPIVYTVMGLSYFVISAMEWTYLGPLMIISSSAILYISKKQLKRINVT